MGKLGCKPIDSNWSKSWAWGSIERQRSGSRYVSKITGTMIYLSHTRLDIAYAMNVVSQFMHNPKEVHLQAVYRILQYFKGSLGMGILFRNGTDLFLEVYTDADYVGSIVDRRSTSGYRTFLGGNLVSWRSKKQPMVVRYSAEAEFRTMTQGICELWCLKIIFEGLQIKWEGTKRLYYDNKSDINIVHNPVQYDWTKHVEVDRHFIKEKLESGLICTPFASSDRQLADVFIKGLTSTTFQAIIGKLGMDNIYSLALRGVLEIWIFLFEVSCIYLCNI